MNSSKDTIYFFESLVKSDQIEKARNLSFVFKHILKLHESIDTVYNCSVGVGSLSVDINGRLSLATVLLQI